MTLTLFLPVGVSPQTAGTTWATQKASGAAHRPSPQFERSQKLFGGKLAPSTIYFLLRPDFLSTTPLPPFHSRLTYLTASNSFFGNEQPPPAVKMSAPQLNKIAATSASRQNPSELETSIAGALYDLESNTADLKAALRPLQFVSAKEV